MSESKPVSADQRLSEPDTERSAHRQRHLGSNDSAILQRRLEFAWEEISRLTKELANARRVPQEKDAASSAQLKILTQELDAAKQSLQEYEQLLPAAQAQHRRLASENKAQAQRLSEQDQQLESTHRELDIARKAVSALEQNEEDLEYKVENLEVARAAAEASSGIPNDTEGGDRIAPRAPNRRHQRPPGFFTASVPAYTLVLLGVAAIAAMLGVRQLPQSTPGALPLPVDPPPRAQRGSPQTPDRAGPSPGDPTEPLTIAADAIAANGSGPVEIQRVQDRLRIRGFGPEMLVVEGGKFAMGNRTLLPIGDESPQHEVEMRRFLIGSTEVTFDEYDLFSRAIGRRRPNDFGWGRGQRPVVDISWDDANAYVGWLSRQTGKRYRLPSEAEWEFAARAGTTSAYWWGYETGTGRALCFSCGTPWDNRSTVAVGRFGNNPFGLYDTAGNALEWTQDCYRRGYEGAPTDGSAWLDGDCTYRVARGGAFNKPASSMRSAARSRFSPDTRLNMIGLRVARDE